MLASRSLRLYFNACRYTRKNGTPNLIYHSTLLGTVPNTVTSQKSGSYDSIIQKCIFECQLDKNNVLYAYLKKCEMNFLIYLTQRNINISRARKVSEANVIRKKPVRMIILKNWLSTRKRRFFTLKQTLETTCI